MARFFKIALRRFVPLALLAALTAYLFVYAMQSITIKEYTDVLPETGQQTQPVPEKEDSAETEQPIKIIPDVNEVLQNLARANETSLKNGYVLSDAVFDAGSFVLSEVEAYDASFLPQNAKYTVEYALEDGSTVFYTDYTLRPRMGYISLADKSFSYILDACGKKIPVPDEYNLSFAACRDKNGLAVFVDYVTGIYYVLSEDNTFVPSDYDDVADFRGLYFDYPSYYGVSDNPLCETAGSSRGFGYKINGKNAVNMVYSRAFAFSEGMGCAYDSNNRLYFFGENGKLVLGGLGNAFYGCGNGGGELSLGYYYFDEGLTRATVKTNINDAIENQREILIDTHGKEFPLPSDFKLTAYSCGRILLEKDGIYGYMSSNGSWTSEPVYTYARPYFEGLAVVGEAEGKKGVIDKTGNYVIPPVFDEITDCSGGVICVFDNNTGWHIIHKTTAPIVEEPEPETEEQTGTETEAETEAGAEAEAEAETEAETEVETEVETETDEQTETVE